MPPIEPVYLAAGGALLGVAVTLTAQSRLARLARRHDKTTKTYDRKLELYVDLAKTLELWAEARERFKNVTEKRGRTGDGPQCSQTAKAERDADRARIDGLISDTQMLAHDSPADSEEGRRSKGRAEEILAEARMLKAELSNLFEQRQVLFEQRQVLADAEESFGVLDRLTEHFGELARTLSFIAGHEVTESVAAIVERVIKNEHLSRTERQRFATAVRKELGE